jgi:uncharacterized protein YndB with AHSA1/START domain
MKWLWITLAVLAAIALIAFIVGSLVPREHSASRRIRLARPIGEVWAVVSDVANATSWRKGLKGVEVLPPQDGKTVFRETTGFGPLTMIVDESRPPNRMVLRILDAGGPFGGTWTYVLREDGAGTVISITEDGFVNPALFRFMGRFIFGYTTTIDDVLKSLGKKFAETVEPTTGRA